MMSLLLSGSGPATRKKRIRRLQPILLKEDGNTIHVTMITILLIGSPVFPIKLGGLQVLSLGKVNLIFNHIINNNN